MGDKVVSVFASIVVLAIITTVLLPNRQTPKVISSIFTGFTGAVKGAGAL